MCSLINEDKVFCTDIIRECCFLSPPALRPNNSRDVFTNIWILFIYLQRISVPNMTKSWATASVLLGTAQFDVWLWCNPSTPIEARCQTSFSGQPSTASYFRWLNQKEHLNITCCSMLSASALFSSIFAWICDLSVESTLYSSCKCFICWWTSLRFDSCCFCRRVLRSVMLFNCRVSCFEYVSYNALNHNI
jgi:hypothetical protein